MTNSTTQHTPNPFDFVERDKATAIRRLRETNADLLAALKAIAELPAEGDQTEIRERCQMVACFAIAKAEGR